MSGSERLTHLLPIGKVAEDEVLHPVVAADGSLALEPGESILYEGDHKVTVKVFNSEAGFLGNKQQWQHVVQMEKKARALFTSQRLLYTWPKWKSDKASGSFFDRRVLSPLLERDEGKMVLGGHVRHPWITQVFGLNAKSGG